MKKYMVVYRSVLMENLQYGFNIIMGFISYFMIIFVFINLWTYLYDSPEKLISGYTREQMIWYIMITEMIWFGARSSAVSRQASTNIRGGNIAYFMNKPYHYTLYLLAEYSGSFSIQLPMYAAFSVIMGITMVGPLPGFHPASLVGAVPCMILGVMINAVFKLCISLISFWIEDANPFHWLYDKLLLVVGTIFPLEIFPAPLQPLFKLTPIYTVCYGPAKLIVDFSMEKCIEILLAQTVYLIFGCCLMFMIYAKGVKKLYVNGG